MNRFLNSPIASALIIVKPSMIKTDSKTKIGLNRDLNPGPLAPKARIIPLDHWALKMLEDTTWMNYLNTTLYDLSSETQKIFWKVGFMM